MINFFKKLKDKAYYSIESIKNRYPCKIVKVDNLVNFKKPAKITYQAVTRFNVSYSSIEAILNDKMIIEKFHPTDGVKMGFLAAGEILLKQHESLEQAKLTYTKIIEQMFEYTEPLK